MNWEKVILTTHANERGYQRIFGIEPDSPEKLKKWLEKDCIYNPLTKKIMLTSFNLECVYKESDDNIIIITIKEPEKVFHNYDRMAHRKATK